MSMPLDPQVIQPPPPPPFITYTGAHSGFGHAGPLIAVLAIITILGLLAGVLGRLCSGRSVMGYRHYDWESWVETKFASCIDGSLGPTPPPPPPPPPDASRAGDSVRVTMPVEAAESRTGQGEC